MLTMAIVGPLLLVFYFGGGGGGMILSLMKIVRGSQNIYHGGLESGMQKFEIRPSIIPILQRQPHTIPTFPKAYITKEY